MEYFSHLSESELRQGVRRLRRLNYAELTEPEILREFNRVFSGAGSAFALPMLTNRYSKGTAFYRARGIPDDDHTIPNKTLNNVSAAWEPPKDICQLGRVNRKGQSVLYACAHDPVLATLEAKADSFKYCVVFKYLAKEEINCAVIGDERAFLNVSDETSRKLEIVFDLLDD